MFARPVEQIEIEPVGREARERFLAGAHGPGARRILRQHLGDEEDLVPPARDRLADAPFGGAGAVHLGGVDVGHAEIEPAPQGGHGLRLVALLEVPRALPDHRDVPPRRRECARLHGSPPRKHVARATMHRFSCACASRAMMRRAACAPLVLARSTGSSPAWC
jgi:hypothetical protein